MPIAVVCNSCQAKLKVPDAAAGKTGKCPQCGTVIRVPASQPPTEPAATARTQPPPTRKQTAPSEPQQMQATDAPAPRPGTAARRVPQGEGPDTLDPPSHRENVQADEDGSQQPQELHQAYEEVDKDDQPKKRPRKKIVDENRPKKRQRKEEVSSRAQEKANLADSQLFDVSQWRLRKQPKRIVLPVKKPYRCDFYDMDGQTHLGIVKERCNAVMKMLFGRFTFLNIDLEFRDSETDPLLFAVRVPGVRFTVRSLFAILGLPSRTVEVVDADGELVASFVMKLAFTAKFHVYDGNDEKIGDFRFSTFDMKNKLPARMILTSLDGQELGTITGQDQLDLMKQIESGKKVIFSAKLLPKEPDLIVSLNANAPDPMAAKKLLMAAAIAMRLFNVHTMFDDNKKV
jgi:hypothetical protein